MPPKKTVTPTAASTRPRRGAAAAAATATAAAASKTAPASDESDVEVPVKATTTTKRTKKADPPKSADDSPQKKPKRVVKKRGSKKDEKEEDEDEEDDQKANAGKAGKATAAKMDVVDDEPGEDDVKAKSTKSKRVVKKRGSKKEEEEDKDDQPDAKMDIADPEEEPEEEVVPVKVVKKGAAVVDTGVPAHVSKEYHVLEKDGVIYDALLNQTDIGNNNNKFYIIQVLKHDSTDKYITWTRWGRVGNAGQSQNPPFSSAAAAIKEFESKFKAKTQNLWADRENFEKHPGKYYLLERDWGDDTPNEADVKSTETDPKDNKPIPESKLDPAVQDIVRLIFNLEMMEKEMTEIGYDAKKMPLGKLTKKTIEKGYLELKAISEELDRKPQPRRNVLEQLSSNFYTIIPHVFGMTRPPVINTNPLLTAKLRMVEALGDIQITTTLLKTTLDRSVNPIDSKFDILKIGMSPLDKKSDGFKLVQDYTKNTHGHTHTSYELEVAEVFEVKKEDSFEDLGAQMHNRKLLWHGSRLTNYAGILSQGLRIAPPEAPVTGYMFGKGVYFADMVSKSANYCFTTPYSTTGLLLLCEVALGDENKLTRSDYHADLRMQETKTHSTWGMGRTVPDPKGSVTLPDGVVVPCGKGVKADGSMYSLEYNEFICYDLRQVRLRYLVKMNFKYGGK